MALNNHANGNGHGGGFNPDAANKNEQSRESIVRQYAARLGLDEDDPAMVFVQANAALEGKVDLWNTVILELVQITREQSRAMQETAENSLKLMQALARSETESQQLRELISKLEHTLSLSRRESRSKPSTELNQSAVQSLMPQFQSVNSELETIRNKLDRHRQTARSHAAGNVKQQRLTNYLLMGMIGLLLGVGFLHLVGLLRLNEVGAGQQFLSSQSSWALTKLERVEQVLGIKPGK
ncbi:MAG: hypothetical protein IGR76_10425 [Synechococcales cyanobacterium T60_A2020_003]|nr:hypothetical protein [Synechococcales cyanobacterium T60_A2020_003]